MTDQEDPKPLSPYAFHALVEAFHDCIAIKLDPKDETDLALLHAFKEWTGLKELAVMKEEHQKFLKQQEEMSGR